MSSFNTKCEQIHTGSSKASYAPHKSTPSGDEKESRMTDKLVQRAQNALKLPRGKISRNKSAIAAKE